jgi:hypothetical protein
MDPSHDLTDRQFSIEGLYVEQVAQHILAHREADVR